MSTTSSALSGSERTGSLNTILIVLLVLAIAFAAADFIYLTIKSNHDRQASSLTTQVQVLSQALTTYAANAAGGNELAFDELKKTTGDIDAFLGYLNKGNAKDPSPYAGMPSYANEPGVEKELKDLNAAWAPVLTNATKILDGKSLVLDTATTSQEFGSKMPVLNSRMNEVVNILTERNGSAGQVYISTRQMLLADRMIRRVQEIGQGGEDAQSAADGFSRDAALYRSVLDGLIDGAPALNIRPIDQPNAKQILVDVQQQWQSLDEPVSKIIDASTGLQVVKQAADAIFTDSQSVLLKARNVADRLDTLGTKRTFPNPLWGGIAAAAAIVLVILLGITLVRDQQNRYQMSAELNQRNQEAILRLLDEMGSLAEGDLTVKATVTEDITGAIADSINFAVEALRSLVTTINETAVQVSAAAQETQATAMHLAEAAEHQAQQITSASAAINEIAVSIDEVSKNSTESAEVAQRSVQIAAKGAAIVRQTIQGMDSIRDQIQETSKRIKRLGESSQEIGSIVELINDIAEQTNILALNAAIQAASAGEAGRGFAVVADEVQRLAERASNATKRIETLVQTIQSDTNEAVSSMEQTTAEVVAGARLAEDAGLALGEIEKVSHDLADLIQSISAAASQQSAAATNISATMNVIQEITTQTSVGASQTAESIGNLAHLAGDLRRSVADFKLPG
ncbi:MAG: methyl-accepting chemotaxis protein [Dokdonella sp.]|uniref:Twitching motility protein PilJ n=1 Tax=Dokdonella immobilis TaxID=578942 RepID=A0A1I4WXP1_9GAMM|nr:methyl-accepting chemotaxis protein [Dokdonella immobilis]MBX3698552.1 type IV pili methyl-accepting chemotaxis transducer N-terminal domain-containing protein [Dokdonella sp.]MCB1572801.1 type IV pili methyl-accepting chemotaxis transducer N-terminal domain-containing protein [Xanthomonadales bacterium]SFN17880.1 twitching motility protein PilJ [Dokdonella immobilis]